MPSQSGAARHDAALLGRCGAVLAAAGPGDGRAFRPRRLLPDPPRLLAWVQLVLATPVVLWGGWPFFRRGWASLVTRSLNMFTLIALGTGVAYVFSLVAALAPGIFPASFRDADGQVPVYFEAAAVIVTLVLLGQVLELRARSQTGSAIRALLDLAPKTRPPAGETAARKMSRLKRSFRRPPAGAAGREGPGRRRRARRPQRGRRIHDHRRADAGREGPRRQGDRRHRERHRQLS